MPENPSTASVEGFNRAGGGPVYPSGGGAVYEALVQLIETRQERLRALSANFLKSSSYMRI